MPHECSWLIDPNQIGVIYFNYVWTIFHCFSCTQYVNTQKRVYLCLVNKITIRDVSVYLSAIHFYIIDYLLGYYTEYSVIITSFFLLIMAIVTCWVWRVSGMYWFWLLMAILQVFLIRIKVRRTLFKSTIYAYTLYCFYLLQCFGFQDENGTLLRQSTPLHKSYNFVAWNLKCTYSKGIIMIYDIQIYNANVIPLI